MSKKTTQQKWRGLKKAKNVFFIILKIPDCGPTGAARELKKEVNVPTESTNKKKYQKIQKVFIKKNFLENC